MESDHETCPVCHEAVTIFAIGSCDHPICYRCSIRMRALCDQFYCPICRTDLPKVYMVHSIIKESEIPRYGYTQNRKLKVFFEDNRIRQKIDKLQEHRCPKCRSQPPYKAFKDLQYHARKEHSLFYCDLCVDHLKVFTSERKYYTRQDLATHRRVGDKNDSSYKGHPLCRFCDERYMDNDELFRHLRKDHYYCHFCESDGSQDYYGDYEDLRQHFQEKHYLCEEGECVHAQFTHAFRSEIDFKAHISTSHNKILTKAQARQSRTIDVNIQLAPRRPGRMDRGAVAEEEHRNKERGHVHKRAAYRDRFREEDMQQAIQASLSVMKEDNPKKSDSKKSSDEETEKDPGPMIKDEEHFPTLGVASTSGRPHTPTNPENNESDASLARKVAKANSMSVQHGHLGMAEFPSLGSPRSGSPLLKTSVPPTSSSSVSSSKYSRIDAPVTSVSSDKHKNSSNKISDKKSTNSKPKTLQNDDFPELPVSKAVNANKSAGQWVKTQPPPPRERPQSQTNMQNINIIKNIPTEPKPSAPKSQNRIPNRNVLNDDKEFPSLGGPSGNALNFFMQQNKEEQKSKKSSQIDWFDIEQDEFNIENFKGDKANIDLYSETKSKNKKKKKKKQKDPSDSNSSSKSASALASASTLDNIANSLFASKSTPVVNGTDKKPESEEWQMVPPKAKSQESVKISEKESVKRSEKEPVKSSEKSKPVKSSEKSKPKESLKLHGETPKTKSPFVEDFPVLESTSGSSSKAPPPGFQNATKSPPGFSDVGHGSRPPPGFMSNSVTKPEKEDSQKMFNDALKDISLKTLLPVNMDAKNFQYHQPKNFQARNHSLISDISRCLDEEEDDFSQFKSWSGLFRAGQMEAIEYYAKCESLLHEENFATIFPELLVLLPDIGKQQELLSVYKSATTLKESKSKDVIKINDKKSGWNSDSRQFSVCDTCQQVLLQSDHSNHVLSHGLESDFPSLHSSTPSGGVGLRHWIKSGR